MKITIDCNNDTLTISSETEAGEDYEYDIKNPIQWLKILEEIFTRLPSLPVSFSIELEKIDEDTRTTIESW